MELSRADWADHLEQWRRSGETATRYCEEHGLKLGSLRYWSGRIRGESGRASNETLESSPPRFAKVRRRGRSEASGDESSAVRLHVGEVQVVVGRDFDADTLGRVLEVLRSTGGGR
jgi:hypothetical protein